MRPFTARVLLLSALLLTAGCGARQGTTGQRVDRDLITQEQIRQNCYRTAFEAVEALRAPWLLTRPDGLTVEREKIVYLDERRLGGVQTLRDIVASQIISIRHIDPGTAINRWGVDHGAGVIQVVTRR
jgi:hypothetical protein